MIPHDGRPPVASVAVLPVLSGGSGAQVRDTLVINAIALQRRLRVDMSLFGMYSASGPSVNSKEAEDVASVSHRRGRLRYPQVYA